MSDTVEAIATYNAGRDPERLRMKYSAMRTTPFVFLRGTCHLFYAHLPPATVLDDAPPVWICGDMHLENFGSYKADNRLIYFDINDFDEACVAPAPYEMVRLLTSLLIGADDLKVSRAQALALCHATLDAYSTALGFGKARWIEEETASGLVGELFAALHTRKRVDHLNRRTELKDKKRVLRVDGKKALPLDPKRKQQVIAFIDRFASQESDPAFFKVLDVARRIAGTGSLGVDRYVILVEGKGSPDGNYLIDLKQTLRSSVVPRLTTTQPVWSTQAQRVVEVQRRCQVVSQAFLHAVECDGQPYVLRSLQPSEDRVALAEWNGKLPRLEAVVRTMGELAAWAQLRSGGRQGSAIADDLIAYGNRRDWQAPLIDLALKCEAQVQADWKAYCDAFDRGEFKV
ncbi:DUF2252 domain-containing protein [Paraburkholderia sp.]|uniref:DUF2252 domain-containing protein n=1 Tax=Paraburkholderia sp. TaxID=1926495 RepID=UPI002398A708|nr:DUF2252 domain-containing protein [Paraburkholderia sp.]MDE1182286.1 DUF2252 domain-containing protein [Paraburkholderia sp.]